MSGLQYDYTRNEHLVLYDATHSSRYTGKFDGRTLAFGLELVRPLRWTDSLLFLPTIALDHQSAEQDTFTEEGGYLPQRFSGSELQQTLIRIGLNTKIGKLDSFKLNTRLQYAIRLDDSAPTTTACFAELANAPTYIVEGIAYGSNYVNLGVGTEIWLNDRGNSILVFDYDADLSERAASNSVRIGANWKW